MESSASKVTPRVLTTLKKGMDASPTEKQSTWTVSVLDDGPQRSTAFLLLTELQFVFLYPYFYLATAGLNISQSTQRRLRFSW